MTIIKDFALALFWSVLAVALGVSASIILMPGSF